MKDIKKIYEKHGGKYIFLIIFVLIILAFVGGALIRPQRSLRHKETPEELIRELDRAMASIKAKRDFIASTARAGDLYLRGDIKLTGISWNVQEPFVIINDEVMKVGEEVGGLKVVGIKKRSVKLRDKNGNEKVEFLYKDDL